ncbi:MAG: antibiotic biosynthesis monooxygenase [Acidobacteriota bacterium]|nr:antibiotic biosynthesis monooxygenase [Acidobacteriota bacterium]
MFVVLYRWRVRPNLEQQFVENWSARTAYLREKYDSLGSRLHRGSDGIWYSYAQWKSAEQREQAFNAESNTVSKTSQKFQEAIEESFPEIQLEVISDYLILPKKL